jgi:formiminoglutamase
MDDWQEILEPSLLPDSFFKTLGKHALGSCIERHKNGKHPDIELSDIVILGVPEDRNAEGNHGSSKAPDKIREQLFKLMNRTSQVKIADIGNIKPGKKTQDTYIALSLILSELIRSKKFPIILGGSNDIAYANYLAYEKIGQIINIAALDHRFDLGTPDSTMNSQTYLNKIVLSQPNYLFNYTNIGYQTYFIDSDMSSLMNQLFFDSYRLGIIRSDIDEAEPLLRNADMLCVDTGCIRQSDAPANEHASPNGFYGEEICRICRYAGMSDKLTSAGFYELNPVFDQNEQSAKLIAQMIWFLIEGYSLRKHDNPRFESDDYIRYHVFSKKADREILFYKSKKSGRWWMEVPCPANSDERYKRHYLIACSYKDYQTALQDELPDKWWQTYQKIM